ncbi:MAG: hypothetical protein VB934_03300 [Polyangiaceae bacterium]
MKSALLSTAVVLSAAALTINCGEDETRRTSVSTVSTSSSTGGAAGHGGAGGTSQQSSSSMGGAGGTTDPASGVVVVAGTNQGVDVLYVLDRDGGETLSNEPQKTAGIVYDGRADSWLMFVTEDLPVPPGTKGTLFAKRFNLEFNMWQLLETVDPVELPRHPRDIIVFGESLLYLAERNTPPGTDLVAFRVGDPTHIESFFPEAIDVSTTAPSDTILGLTGSSVGAIKGGTAHVVIQHDLGGGNCQLMLHRHTVTGATASALGSPLAVGPNYDCAGRPAWAADDKSATLLVAIPPPSGGSEGVLLRIQPKTLSIDQQIPLSFSANAAPQTFASMTLDTCNQVALLASHNGSALHGVWAVPLDARGQAAWLATAQPLNQVSYDAGHHWALLANGEATNFGIGAHLLKGNCLAPLFGVVTPAQWTAPVFLSPHTTISPQKLPFSCPPGCTL